MAGATRAERLRRLQEALDRALQMLLQHYDPDKVILFGSAASGSVGEWSDLDLVIIKRSSLPFPARLKEVALLCDAPVGVDYLVYTGGVRRHGSKRQPVHPARRAGKGTGPL